MMIIDKYLKFNVISFFYFLGFCNNYKNEKRFLILISMMLGIRKILVFCYFYLYVFQYFIRLFLLVFLIINIFKKFSYIGDYQFDNNIFYSFICLFFLVFKNYINLIFM